MRHTRMVLEKWRRHIPENRRIRKSLTDLRIRLFERHLMPDRWVEPAENDAIRKRRAVARRENRHPRAAAGLKRQIGLLCGRNPDVRAVLQADPDCLTDLKFHGYAYGFLPFEYICYGFRSKTREERKSFVSDLERNIIIYRMNDIRAISLFADKGNAYELLKEFYGRECLAVEGKTDYQAFRAFAEKHPVLVKKPAVSEKGRAVERMDLSSGPGPDRRAFERLIRDGKQILEEPIVQSREMAAFNASSVNTVRCATILTRQGPEILFCGLTAGRAGSFVNNGGAGGILAGIDPETGILNTGGVDEYCFRYEAHPDSGVPFAGYRIPDWNGMLRTCREASLLAGRAGCRYAGWDMAHTENRGWVIVEGNGGGQLIGAQIASRYGIRETVESLLQRL